MDLKKALLSDRSKPHMEHLAEIVSINPELFSDLWHLIKTEESPLPERGSWLFEKSALRNLTIAQPHLEEIITYLPVPNHNSIHRNLSKIVAQFETIPEKLQGNLYSLCIERILSPPVHVAIKVYSMTIAFNIAKDIPELREELALVINDQMEFNSAGFKSRGNKILKAIHKINKG